MSKRDDDDWEFFDPLKFAFGCCKVLFNIVKYFLELLIKR
jgi:hypothetical protein